MKVIFRVDASCLIGSGHIMRCLTLAEALKLDGHQITFICRQYPGNLIVLIRQKGFEVKVLEFSDQDGYAKQRFSDDYQKWLGISQEEDALDTKEAIENQSVDCLIVDHYGLDYVWEREFKSVAKKIMVIDDLANRQHECQVILDQNYYINSSHRYDELVPKECLKLLGANYALIRSEFKAIKEKRKSLLKFEFHAIKNILVYMGAADPQNITLKVLQVLANIDNISQYKINVMAGVLYPYKEKLIQYCESHTFLNCISQPQNFNELLINADLVIGAGGSSIYERSFILLPSIVFVTAENQRQLAKDAAEFGVHYYAGENYDEFNFHEMLISIKNNFFMYLANMENLIDGFGVERVVSEGFKL